MGIEIERKLFGIPFKNKPIKPEGLIKTTLEELDNGRTKKLTMWYFDHDDSIIESTLTTDYDESGLAILGSEKTTRIIIKEEEINQRKFPIEQDRFTLLSEYYHWKP